MSENIVERMRFWSKTRNDNPTAWNLDCAAAADEITRLRAERDEARREICKRISTTRWHPQFPLMSEIEYAEARGWDCFNDQADSK